jgi:hypothetical protein
MRQIATIFAGIVLGILLMHEVGRGVNAQQAQSVAPSEASSLSMNEGRFQIVHIYYSTQQQGTGLVDSQTGKMWLMQVAKGPAGSEIWSLNELTKK